MEKHNVDAEKHNFDAEKHNVDVDAEKHKSFRLYDYNVYDGHNKSELQNNKLMNVQMEKNLILLNQLVM